MSIMSSLRTLFTTRMPSENNLIGFYDMLLGYYLENGMYTPQITQDYYLGVWDEAMKPLRDCANRSVEFFVSKLEPGTIPNAMPILTENNRIIDPIQQIWLWSNFAQNKALVIRMFSLYGDIFIKSVGDLAGKKVYHQYLEPRYVTDFSEDRRGNIVAIRMDIPSSKGNMKATYTEIWDLGGYRTYLHAMGSGSAENLLGSPVDFATLGELGIDFVPFAHGKFRDIGQKRGVGCFVHALDKIDEANRMVTRLHQMLFRYNKPLLAVGANSMDASGRPLPAPAISGLNSSSEKEILDDTIITLPGMARLDSLVPDIKYADALAILQDMMKEIEKDLPELSYAGLREKGELSGKAVRLLLGDAIDRAIEARSNFEAALIKADKHALTLGANVGAFSNVGNYDAGDFDHSFQERDVIPLDESEKADTFKTLRDAGVPLSLAAKLAGYSEEIQAEMGTAA